MCQLLRLNIFMHTFHILLLWCTEFNYFNLTVSYSHYHLFILYLKLISKNSGINICPSRERIHGKTLTDAADIPRTRLVWTDLLKIMHFNNLGYSYQYTKELTPIKALRDQHLRRDCLQSYMRITVCWSHPFTACLTKING